MTVLADWQINELATDSRAPMIIPYVDHQQSTDAFGNKIVSYGLSSYGYDFRIGTHWKVFTNINNCIVDSKDFDDNSFVEHIGDSCIIPPNSFVLASTIEQVHMPRDVVGVVLGKSTLARMGISCLATPLEPGWKGHITLEFANCTPLPVRIYANEGGCQVMFHQGEPCDISYADRHGKYQNQVAGPVTAKV